MERRAGESIGATIRAHPRWFEVEADYAQEAEEMARTQLAPTRQSTSCGCQIRMAVLTCSTGRQSFSATRRRCLRGEAGVLTIWSADCRNAWRRSAPLPAPSCFTS
jgi:hypothetical protein